MFMSGGSLITSGLPFLSAVGIFHASWHAGKLFLLAEQLVSGTGRRVVRVLSAFRGYFQNSFQRAKNMSEIFQNRSDIF